jgi:hypothetical protein
MKLTTTRSGKPKAWAWSYSKLKNFESCPKRHWHVDLAKDVQEEDSEQLTYGNTLHKVIADALSGKAKLPDHFNHLQPWVNKVVDGATKGSVLVEQQLAINADFGKTGWFDNDVWFRAVADVIKIGGPVALVLDWKTGKILEDGIQLALTAATVFAHHPDIHALRTEFIWLKEDATTRADFTRADMPAMWAGVLPRVQMLKAAHDTTSYPAKPGYLCKRYCPVRQCPHNGE